MLDSLDDGINIHRDRASNGNNTRIQFADFCKGYWRNGMRPEI
jgi:hypothetical protein